jgi:hypothetical protein
MIGFMGCKTLNERNSCMYVEHVFHNFEPLGVSKFNDRKKLGHLYLLSCSRSVMCTLDTVCGNHMQ